MAIFYHTLFSQLLECCTNSLLLVYASSSIEANQSVDHTEVGTQIRNFALNIIPLLEDVTKISAPNENLEPTKDEHQFRDSAQTVISNFAIGPHNSARSQPLYGTIFSTPSLSLEPSYINLVNKTKSCTQCVHDKNQFTNAHKTDERVFKLLIRINVRCFKSHDKLKIMIHFGSSTIILLLTKKNENSQPFSKIKNTNLVYELNAQQSTFRV